MASREYEVVITQNLYRKARLKVRAGSKKEAEDIARFKLDDPAYMDWDTITKATNAESVKDLTPKRKDRKPKKQAA